MSQRHEAVRLENVGELERGDLVRRKYSRYLYPVIEREGGVARAVDLIEINDANASEWLVMRPIEEPENEGPSIVPPEGTEGWQKTKCLLPVWEVPVLIRDEAGEVAIGELHHHYRDWVVLYKGDASLSEYPEWSRIPE